MIGGFLLGGCGSSGSSGSSGGRSGALESILQDDQFLLSPAPGVVAHTLDTLRAIGVDRVRVGVAWFNLAPLNESYSKPAFDDRNPASYSAAGWVPYDRLALLATARGIAVDFDVGPPGPFWAMGRPAASLKDAAHLEPSATEFEAFMTAIGRRYSGSYVGPGGQRLPRVSFWSVWNEPNQPGWLLPQWRSARGRLEMASPAIYRSLVDAAWRGLEASGHTPSSDKILVGELAPEGSERPAPQAPITPMPFIRALYCMDDSYHPLQGKAAGALGCPKSRDTSAFVKAHPGLFRLTGFAHHPYSFFLPPMSTLRDPNFVPLANLNRLEHGLDSIFTAYGVDRKLPLYLTEYGYETNPPNPFRGVSLALQSRYLNQAQYLAWKDPRVRSMTQFLLYDSAPDNHYPAGSFKYWSTFQTGLLFLDGRRKPSFRSYRLPIEVPSSAARKGAQLLVWGMLRMAPNNTQQRATIEWRASGASYRAIKTVTTSDPAGIFTTQVSPPGSGTLRIAWVSPSGRTFHSREVAVSVG